MTRLRPIALSVLLVVALAGAAVTPAAATHEDDDAFFDGLGGSDGLLASAVQKTAEYTSKASKRIAAFTAEDTTASDNLDDFAETYNSNSETIEAHVNPRLSGDGDHTTFRVTCEDRDENTATAYLLADYNESEERYENTRVVDEETFEETNRTEDAYIDGDWYICSNAADELDNYVSSFAEPDEDLTSRYYASMMRKYASSVESDLWGVY